MSFKTTRPLCAYNAAGALVDYPKGHALTNEDLANIDERVLDSWKADGSVEGSEDKPAAAAEAPARPVGGNRQAQKPAPQKPAQTQAPVQTPTPVQNPATNEQTSAQTGEGSTDGANAGGEGSTDGAGASDGQ